MLPARVLNISQHENGNISISWQAVDGAVSYNIYRSNSRIGQKTRIASAVQGTTFTDTQANPNRFFNYYSVAAVNASGASFVTISWNYVDTADEYWVYRIINGGKKRISEVPAGEFLARPSFSAWIEDFDINNHGFIIVPVRFGGDVFPERGDDPGGNVLADNWFEVPRTIPSYAIGSTPAFPRAAPRLIDNWRNRSISGYGYLGQDRTNYQGYNVVERIDNPQLISFHTEMFGMGMIVFNQYDDTFEIEREINRIGDAMRTHANVAQFSMNRYAFYFMPGDYNFEGRGASLGIGFYMTISGLGRLPTDTRLNFEGGRSGIFAHAALPLWNELGNAGTQGRNVTHNFWRKSENFEINGMLEWSVSQAAPTRRIRVNGPTSLHYRGGWSSGGFAADMYFNGIVDAGNQQQWYTRSSHFATNMISGGSWNIFTNASSTGAGVYGVDNFAEGGIHTFIHEGMEKMREKPFLYFNTETQRYMVFVPGWRDNSAGGISWADGNPVGKSLDLENDFFIALPGDCATLINAHLASGRHLLLSPGMFEVQEPIFVGNPNTVVLGLGMATVFPGQNNIEGAVMISDVPGVVMASVVLDAHYMSKYLLRVGEVGSNRDHSDNPTFVSDVFVRVGGQVHHAIHTEVSVQINSNNVIGDHFWIWRGDHGRGIRWDRNVGTFGLVVTGNDVTMHGLFVEHYQKYQTIWTGERGRIFFYQSETPYEFPFQVYSHDGTVRGWADIKVANHVQEFYAIGLGFYGVHQWYPTFRYNAMEVPHREGVVIRRAFTNELGAAHNHRGNRFLARPEYSEDNFPVTQHVINHVGDRARGGGANLPFPGANPGGPVTRRVVLEFSNGVGQVLRNGRIYEYRGVEPGDGNLEYLLQWVMQPCGAGVPEGWDPVWNMRPEGWEYRPEDWPRASPRGARARGFWPQGGGR